MAGMPYGVGDGYNRYKKGYLEKWLFLFYIYATQNNIHMTDLEITLLFHYTIIFLIGSLFGMLIQWRWGKHNYKMWKRFRDENEKTPN
jgi:hypothetical protein